MDRSIKKKVMYYEVQNLAVGQSADVRPVNHPDEPRVLNGYWAHTSEVLEIHPDGKTFETKNTLYMPMQDFEFSKEQNHAEQAR